MSTNRTAFQDAMLLTGTANTATYLRNRLATHPIVTFLVDSFSAQQLLEKLREESQAFDGSLEKVTIVYILLIASLQKCADMTSIHELVTQLASRKIPWLKELVDLSMATSIDIPNTVVVQKFMPSVARAATLPNTNNSFATLAWKT